MSTDLELDWFTLRQDEGDEARGGDAEFPWETEDDETAATDLVLEIRGECPVKVIKAPEDLSWSIKYTD